MPLHITEISRIPVYIRSFEAKHVVIQFLETFLHLPDFFILTSYKITHQKAAKQDQSTVPCSVPLTPTILSLGKKCMIRCSNLLEAIEVPQIS